MIFSCNCLVYLENGCTFAPRKRGRCYWNRGCGQVHIDVGLPGDKKKNLFFSQSSCRVKKQLYICSRLGKHLGETKDRKSRDVGLFFRSSLKYCGEKESRIGEDLFERNKN